MVVFWGFSRICFYWVVGGGGGFYFRVERGLMCLEYFLSEVVRDCFKDWLIFIFWIFWIEIVTN